MTISTVETKLFVTHSRGTSSAGRARHGAGYFLPWALLLLSLLSSDCQTVLGPWTPIFDGVDHARGTNTPGPGALMNNLQVVNALRIDLGNTNNQLFATPRISNYSTDSHETAGYATSNFLKMYKLQVVVNANYFHDPGTPDTESPNYSAPQGTPYDVIGLLMSRGQTVSAQEGPVYPSSFLFATNNQATFVPTNWPAVSAAGTFTAVSGLYAVLVGGRNIASNYLSSSAQVHQINPRTAFGLSQDRRYLYLLTIDGRQGGYSDGAVDWETAAWLFRVGAWDGANMDGGGSTCMVMQDSTGNPVELNRSSASADPNTRHERTVGCHFGVFASPVSAFIGNVNALADDTAATVTWTTTGPATSLVQYGLTPNLGSASSYSASLVTNHAVLLTGLTPGDTYYFKIFSTAGANQHTSSNYTFTTRSSVLFDFTNNWTYATTNLDGVNWTAPGYDDSAWDGSGPGLLWVDNGGPNPSIPMLNTAMSLDPSTGSPFPTYYFRTHYSYTNPSPVLALTFTNYLNDGAIYYLNGSEIYRLRMPDAPSPIYNSTPATNFPCNGEATCTDTFVVSGDPLTNLVSGDNVLAVEVHNYYVGGVPTPQITFGASLSFISTTTPPELVIQRSDPSVTVSWTRGGFKLQQAGSSAGPWADAPGPIVSSPFTTTNSGSTQYFRLIR
jgi:exopolysaccharide biosynthesis protein